MIICILGFVSGSRGYKYIYINIYIYIYIFEYMDFYFEIIKRNYWIF